jgi:hypothetical protein
MVKKLTVSFVWFDVVVKVVERPNVVTASTDIDDLLPVL